MIGRDIRRASDETAYNLLEKPGRSTSKARDRDYVAGFPGKGARGRRKQNWGPECDSIKSRDIKRCAVS